MTALRLQRAARPPIHCELRLQGEEVKTRQLQDAPASPTQRVQTSNQASRSRQKPSAVNQLRNPLLRPQLDSRLICLLFRSGRKKLPHARYPTHSPDRRTCPRRRSGGDFSAQNANQVLPLLFPPPASILVRCGFFSFVLQACRSVRVQGLDPHRRTSQNHSYDFLYVFTASS